jgi:hypothetical protein
MATTDKNIVITPNIGQNSDPKIAFSGANTAVGAQTINLNVYPNDGGTISFEGSSGQLFSITNKLTGTLFSVNDVSGIPSIEVLDTGLVKIAQYGGNVQIGSASSLLTQYGNASLGLSTGSESLRVTPIASAVNYLNVYGAATGNQVNMRMEGSDTNIGFNITTKGIGTYDFYTGTYSSLQFGIGNTASAVNYLRVTGSTTGNAATILAQGSDANVSINLTAKGTGTVNVSSGLYVNNAWVASSIPVVLNDISNQFDGTKTVFSLMLDQDMIYSIVDSKDLEVVINGARLSPYVNTQTYPWISNIESFNGFRVKSNNLIIYNAPFIGDSASLIWRNASNTTQTKKYPYSAASIALGD